MGSRHQELLPILINWVIKNEADKQLISGLLFSIFQFKQIIKPIKIQNLVLLTLTFIENNN